MNKSLISILLISISSFILLELAFFLEGFIQFILFSLVTIISFVLLFLFNGYRKEVQNRSKKVLVFAALMAFPLVSVLFNPTMYFHTVPEKQILLVARNHPDQALSNSSESLTLLKDGSCHLKEVGFWTNTTKKGKYRIDGKKIMVALPKNKMTFTIRKNSSKELKLCTKKKSSKLNKNCFVIEKTDRTFRKNMKKEF